MKTKFVKQLESPPLSGFYFFMKDRHGKQSEAILEIASLHSR